MINGGIKSKYRIKKKIIAVMFITLLVVFIGANTFSKPVLVSIKEIKIETIENTSKVIIGLNKSIKNNDFKVVNGLNTISPYLAVDISNAQQIPNFVSQNPNDNIFKMIYRSQYRVKPLSVIRVVFNLKGSTLCSVYPEGAGLAVKFIKGGKARLMSRQEMQKLWPEDKIASKEDLEMPEYIKYAYYSNSNTDNKTIMNTENIVITSDEKIIESKTDTDNDKNDSIELKIYGYDEKSKEIGLSLLEKVNNAPKKYDDNISTKNVLEEKVSKYAEVPQNIKKSEKIEAGTNEIKSIESNQDSLLAYKPDVPNSTASAEGVNVKESLGRENAIIKRKLNKIKHSPSILDKKPLVDIDFKDVDVSSALRALSKLININIVIGDDVKGKVSGRFSRAKSKDVLSSIVGANGYSWQEVGGVISVSSQRPVKKYLIKYTDASNILSSLKEIMPDEKGQISLEENTNSIIVKANRMTLDYFDKIIAELDEMPLQVLVEAQIIELDLNKDRTVGSNPGYSHNTNNFIRAKGLATDYTSGTTGMFAQLLSGKWAVTIQALQTAKKAKTLANPKILTLNHKEAKIITGEKLGYYTSTTTQTSTVQNVDFLEVGTKLTFIPHVSEDGYIMMEIKPEVSAGDIVNGLPQKQTTETDTKILVKDGQTIVISGLIKIEKSRNETGIPILSDIPLLGSFFRKSIHKNDKSEIIVLITPHILYDTEQDWMIQSVEETKTKMNQINPSFIH